MTVSSLLISFSDFKWVLWVVLGVAALILLIVFIVGCKKGFSNMSLRPVSWMFGCGLFIVLDYFQHDKCFITDIVAIENPSMASFASSMTWLVIALLARWIVFGLIYRFMKWSKNAKLKKVERNDVKEKETGEEILPDENKKYKALPINGKIKPGPLNRLFGGIFSIVIVLIVLGFIASIALVVLNVTPFKESLSVLYENEVFVKIFGYLRTYTLDFLLIALLVGVICNGYKSGGFAVFRTVMIFAVYAVAMVGSFYAPFSPWIAEGQPLHFLGQVIDYLGGMVVGFIPADMPIAIPEGVVFGAVKVVRGLVLCIVLSLLAKMVAWLLNKMQDSVDESDSACVIDGIFGSIIYFFFGVLLVGLVCAVLYLLRYYGVYDTGVFFTESSPIVNGFFGVFEELLKPYLESLGGMIGM